MEKWQAFRYDESMSDSFLDHIPSREREKIKKKMRTPEAYERLREKVKGPEDLKSEMEKSEKTAELSFALESEPHMQEKMKATIEKDMKEKGIDAMLDLQHDLPESVRQSIAEGKFTVTVSSHPTTHHDVLAVLPEGNITDRIPLKQKISDAYAGHALQAKR